MQKIKKEEGITLLVLVITVAVLILISVPVVVNTTEIIELQRYTYFKGDIDKLRESIGTTYSDSKSIATIGPRYTGDLEFLSATQNGENVKNPNDDSNYYVIDLSELNSHLDAQIDLKYGSGNKIEDYSALEINQGKDPNDTTTVQYEFQGKDTYIINAKTKTIYYTDGIEYKEEKYYRLPEDFTEISNVYAIAYDVNGANDSIEMQIADASNSYEVILQNAPTRTGYTFAGWKDKDSDDIFNPGDAYVATKDITLIAQWENEYDDTLEIGQKVTYSPNGSYIWESKYYNISTDENVTLDSSQEEYKIENWRVLEIDKEKGEVTLIAESPTEGTVPLRGTQGYNNGVYLLNEACKSLYGNKEKGIKARSINIEDIEKYMKDEAISNSEGTGAHDYVSTNSGVKYGEQKTSAYSASSSKYPIIYAKEKLAVIDGVENSQDSNFFGMSEQDKAIEITDDGANYGYLNSDAKQQIHPYNTHWIKDATFMQTAFKESVNGVNYYDLLIPKGSSTNYWIASRCVDLGSTNCFFYMRDISDGGVSVKYMYNSYVGNNNIAEKNIYPIVTLNVDFITGNKVEGFRVE